jgi:hypothetical protein
MERDMLRNGNSLHYLSLVRSTKTPGFPLLLSLRKTKCYPEESRKGNKMKVGPLKMY